MSEPKILRRCTTCGAASRPGALFCPQCGNATGKRRKAALLPADQEEVQSAPPLNPGLQTRSLDATEPLIQPQRGELRKAPTVVLDEAAYDPGLRFVLVAAFLFVYLMYALLRPEKF